MKTEMVKSRREFLKYGLGLTAGAVLCTRLGSMAAAVAEETEPEPYKEKPSAPPCKLISEITAADAPAGTRSFKFMTDGRTCSKSVTFDIVGDDQILQNVVYEGGCNGGTQGIGHMSEGRPAAEVSKLLKPVVCDLRKSGSSCGMQLALGIQQALMIINGTACPGCSGDVCVNVK